MTQRCAIIGAGISGLATAYFIQTHNPEMSIDIYDSQDRVGGVIRTEKIAGCIVEGGPDSFLTVKTPAARLCDSLGLGPELVGSNDAKRKTFLFDDGKLKDLPEGFFLMVPSRLRSLISTNLLSWPGKLDALSDLFMLPEQKDCTVSDFIERRFGAEILQKIAEPLLSGIYGADVHRLSMQSALPQIWQMQQKGSMIRQLFARKPPSGSLFTTLQQGMESLILKLKETIRASWKIGRPVDGISRIGDLWGIEEASYDHVVMASSQMPVVEIPEYDELVDLWNSTPRNSAIVVALAYPDLQKTGFGWLVPANERRSVLACTYVSNKFPQRSPENLLLVRAFIGGTQATEWIDQPDDRILNEVHQELERIAGIKSSLAFSRIFRWRQAMPEYQIGHKARVERIRMLVGKHPGLYATGNLFSGVGIPDCIQHAEIVASQVCTGK